LSLLYQTSLTPKGASYVEKRRRYGKSDEEGRRGPKIKKTCPRMAFKEATGLSQIRKEITPREIYHTVL